MQTKANAQESGVEQNGQSRTPLAERQSPQGFVDSRPAAVAQQRLRDLTANSAYARNLQTVQAMVAASPKARQAETLQRQFARSGISDVVQMAISRSATYSAASTGRSVVQVGQIDAALNTLHGLVPTAEANATAGVALAPAARTATQNAYVNVPNAARWGSCVEEQLNLLDAAWAHQHVLPGSRPDYYLNVGGIDTFTDLTTPAAAGMTGNHITGKLATANIAANAAVGADITYTGGAAVPPAVEVWRQAAFDARQNHRLARGEIGGGEVEYNAWADENAAPSEQDIWAMDQAECEEYADTVADGLAGNIEVSDDDISEASSDEEERPTKRQRGG